MTDTPIGRLDWLASYPKSGNTWMRMLLANYFSNSDQAVDINGAAVSNFLASHRAWFDDNLGIASSDLTDNEIMELRPYGYDMVSASSPDRNWVKVHDAQRHLTNGRWLLPPEASGCAIYIVRNPLDVAVSFAFHFMQGNMDLAVEKMANPDAVLSNGRQLTLCERLGTWSQHVTSWVDQSPIPTLTVRYEDMLQDTPRELARVLAFARPDERLDLERIDRAAEYSAFENLRAEEQKGGFKEGGLRQSAFFREGRAGGWKDHLSTAQAERICGSHSAVMARFAYGMD